MQNKLLSKVNRELTQLKQNILHKEKFPSKEEVSVINSMYFQIKEIHDILNFAKRVQNESSK